MVEKAKTLLKLEARLEAMLERVRSMEPGGDLESLLEEETAQLKRSVYEAALEQRHQAVEEADFSP